LQGAAHDFGRGETAMQCFSVGGFGFAETGLVRSDRIVSSRQVGKGVDTVGARLDDLGQAGIHVLYGDDGVRHGRSRRVGNGPPDGAAILSERSGSDHPKEGQ